MKDRENRSSSSNEGMISRESERETKIQEFLTRGVHSVYPSADALADKLRSDTPLKAYLGIDPTAPEMHVGHVSQLQRMRRLQELGHHVTLLLGDFTARIGDPTDKSASRIRLSPEQVQTNARSYQEQAAKILDFENSENPVELRYNSEWLDPMRFQDVLELAADFTVQQMLKRSMFQTRMQEDKPINLTEFMYPLMQGYDSVALDVDIEFGGSDQIFNMLVGRDLMKHRRGKEKYVVAGDLLVDPSGRKIGKSEGNMITLVDTPEGMYQKIMHWGDGIVPHALEIISALPMDEVKQVEEDIKNGKIDGHTAKMLLARQIVSELHSPDQASFAEEVYQRRLRGEFLEEEIPELHVSEGASIIDVLVSMGMVKGRREARRLIEQKGIRINGSALESDAVIFDAANDGLALEIGKKQRRSIVVQRRDDEEEK